MPRPYNPITFEASKARLITRASAEKPGMADYTIKRDVRRDFDLDVRREGYDYFWPNTTGGFTSNPGMQPFPATSPITLVHLARRPNGQTAIIVGTQTTLYRYVGLASQLYVDANYVLTGYIEEDAGAWQIIGDGFSANGHRWEAEDINGFSIFNNGVDLPVTYRLEDQTVKPIYELREQGIASVGTIGVIDGILMCGDIRELKDGVIDTLLNTTGDISSGSFTASQSGTAITSENSFFTAAHVGRTLVWADGDTVKINAVINAKSATASASFTKSNVTFTLRNKGALAGSTFSGLTTGAVLSSSTSLTISGGSYTFSSGVTGKTITFASGFSATLTYVDATHATLSRAPNIRFAGEPFWVSDATSNQVVSEADAFDSSMVGLSLLWDTGEVRRIIAYINSKTVAVDDDSPIASGYFTIQNANAYTAFTDDSRVNRIQYRVLWGIPDDPRRFGSVVLGNMLAGSNILTLDYPLTSFGVGDEIVVVGAGDNGGNLTAIINAIAYLGKALTLSIAASTRIVGATVLKSDAIGSIAGYNDLQGDSSGILRIKDLGKFLVIYKDTSCFIASYTGQAANPFDFRLQEIPDSTSLFYRWTLINVGGEYHIYAGVDRFYRFDLTSRIPQAVPELEYVSNIFYDQVSLANTDAIFAADNAISSEVWFQFPSSGADKGICYDYRYSSASTTSISVSAAATVKKPNLDGSPAETIDWFVMGNTSGTVLLYGKTAETPGLFYRRSLNPFSVTKGAYESRLKSGAESFGDQYNEKDIYSYVLLLGSSSPNCTVGLTLYGFRNTGETPATLLSASYTNPVAQNLESVFYRQVYYQDELVINGVDNPCKFAGKILDVSHVNSKSHLRRP